MKQIALFVPLWYTVHKLIHSWRIAYVKQNHERYFKRF